MGIAWVPPTDAIFKFQDGMGAQGSIADISAGQSKSQMQGDENKSDATGLDISEADMAENFYKVKHVFDILIEESPYLIDDKAFKSCEGKTRKEQFLIMIDSIRKSLSIETMDDVKLLVDTFYEFGPKKKERIAREDRERLAAKEAAQLALDGGKEDGKKKGKEG